MNERILTYEMSKVSINAKTKLVSDYSITTLKLDFIK